MVRQGQWEGFGQFEPRVLCLDCFQVLDLKKASS